MFLAGPRLLLMLGATVANEAAWLRSGSNIDVKSLGFEEPLSAVTIPVNGVWNSTVADRLRLITPTPSKLKPSPFEGLNRSTTDEPLP